MALNISTVFPVVITSQFVLALSYLNFDIVSYDLIFTDIWMSFIVILGARP
jgi:hypothetical protein